MQNVRTQITLPKELKTRIESAASTRGYSLAEFLRRAATKELDQEGGRKARLKALADQVVGSLDLSVHPEWKDEKAIRQWSRQMREEWDDNAETTV